MIYDITWVLFLNLDAFVFMGWYRGEKIWVIN